MRLLVHNFLQCHVKNCPKSYPLSLEVTEWSNDAPVSEYNRAAAIRFLPKIEWPCLLDAARQLGIPEAAGLPAEKPDEHASDQVLTDMMMVLVGRQVKNGKMTCPGCGHIYPIKDAIPNMLLNEDEI